MQRITIPLYMKPQMVEEEVEVPETFPTGV